MTESPIAKTLNSHILITGATGTGKSYAVGFFVEELHKQRTPYVILDTKSQNHLGLWLGKNRLKGLILERIFPNSTATVEQYAEYLKKNKYVLFIPAGGTTIDHLTEEYIKIMQAVQRLELPRHVIVEETHRYCRSANKAIPELDWIAQEGRGYKIWLWSITQRIQKFPKDLWSNCAWTYAFHMRIPHDIRYFADILPEFEELNTQLEKYDILQYSHLQEINPPYRIIKAGEIKRKTTHLG